jgi:hypothetical protein
MSGGSVKNKLKNLDDPRCNKSVFLDNERYDNIKRGVEDAKLLRKNNQPLTSKQYRCHFFGFFNFCNFLPINILSCFISVASHPSSRLTHLQQAVRTVV